MGFDNTIDNRWRPDLDSSQRRVREEEEEAALEPVEVVQSRELAFIPNNRRKAFEPYDAQTRELIAQQDRLYRLPHGTSLIERLSHWHYMDKMRGPEEKQRYIEPLIEAVRRDPVQNEHLLVFLLNATDSYLGTPRLIENHPEATDGNDATASHAGGD